MPSNGLMLFKGSRGGVIETSSGERPSHLSHDLEFGPGSRSESESGLGLGLGLVYLQRDFEVESGVETAENGLYSSPGDGDVRFVLSGVEIAMIDAGVKEGLGGGEAEGSGHGDFGSGEDSTSNPAYQ